MLQNAAFFLIIVKYNYENQKKLLLNDEYQLYLRITLRQKGMPTDDKSIINT